MIDNTQEITKFSSEWYGTVDSAVVRHDVCNEIFKTLDFIVVSLIFKLICTLSSQNIYFNLIHH